MFCPLSRNHSDPGNTRRTPTDKAGRELYALMRDQFDRYVYIWEKTTGLHVGRGYARELLSMWRADEGWRYYRASYFNQSFMLFYAAPAQNLVGRYLLVDGPLHCYLKKLQDQSHSFHSDRWMVMSVSIERRAMVSSICLSLSTIRVLSCAASIAWNLSAVRMLG